MFEREKEAWRNSNVTSATVTNTAPTINFTVKEISSMIPEYNPNFEDGITIQQWLRKIELLRVAHNWSDLMILIAIGDRLKGRAKLWLDARDKIFISWLDFKTEIESVFKKADDVADYHQKMINRKQKHNENMLDYIFIQEMNGKQANFSEPVIIKYIIKGLRDSNLSYMLKYKPLTTVKSLVDTIKYVSLYDKENEKEANILKRKLSPNRYSSDNKRSRRENDYLKCFKCGKTGHKTSDCRNNANNAKIMCFRCGKPGHIVRNCTNKSNYKRTHFVKNNNEASVANIKFNELAVKSVILSDGKTRDALIDTGSQVNLIKKSDFDLLDNNNLRSGTITLSGLHESRIPTLGHVELKTNLDNNEYNIKYHVVSDEAINKPIILGMEFLSNVLMVMENGQMDIKPKVCDVLNINIDPNELDIGSINGDTL